MKYGGGGGGVGRGDIPSCSIPPSYCLGSAPSARPWGSGGVDLHPLSAPVYSLAALPFSLSHLLLAHARESMAPAASCTLAPSVRPGSASCAIHPASPGPAVSSTLNLPASCSEEQFLNSGIGPPSGPALPSPPTGPPMGFPPGRQRCFARISSPCVSDLHRLSYVLLSTCIPAAVHVSSPISAKHGSHAPRPGLIHSTMSGGEALGVP